MKRTLLTLVLLSLLVVMTSCNNPLNKKYSEATFEEDIKKIVESEKVDTTNMQLIGMYIVRAKLSGENLEDKTYNDILNDAKVLKIKVDVENAEAKVQADKKEAEAEILADKAAKKEQERKTQLAETVIVVLKNKSYSQERNQEYISIYVAFENKGTKKIKAVKGTLLINDLFDSKIQRLNLVQSEGIEVGETFKKAYSTEYNQFKNDDIAFKNTNLEDMKAVWTTEKIIFADGTTLE